MAGDMLSLTSLHPIVRQRAVPNMVHMTYMLSVRMTSNPLFAQKVNIEGTNNIFEVAIANRLPVVWCRSSLSLQKTRLLSLFCARLMLLMPSEPTHGKTCCSSRCALRAP